jgi:hypothetical protein
MPAIAGIVMTLLMPELGYIMAIIGIVLSVLLIFLPILSIIAGGLAILLGIAMLFGDTGWAGFLFLAIPGAYSIVLVFFWRALKEDW